MTSGRTDVVNYRFLVIYECISPYVVPECMGSIKSSLMELLHD